MHAVLFSVGLAISILYIDEDLGYIFYGRGRAPGPATLPPGQLNSNSIVHNKMFKFFKCCLSTNDQAVARHMKTFKIL